MDKENVAVQPTVVAPVAQPQQAAAWSNSEPVADKQRTTESRPSKKNKKRKNSTKSQPSSASAQKQANKDTNPKDNSQATATLYGLDSLKRKGNVKVNHMADYTTVKSNFLLGPLVLKVEKTFGKSEKRDIRTATATTHEMIGRITLRVVNGVASLHSIKVQQPKQVQVDSSDNHDRTREYVWKRSSNIAHLVSQKLRSATRSMLKTGRQMRI